MNGENRIYLSWNNHRSFIILGASGYSESNKDFQDLVKQHGPPHVVEFRAADEGYEEGAVFEDRDNPVVDEDEEPDIRFTLCIVGE